MEKLDFGAKHPREQIAIIMERIYLKGYTTTSGGNISIMDGNGDIWVTPSGIDKGSLKPADIICVKHDGTIVGSHNPSMEYPSHKAIYENRPDIRAVIHAHPPALVSFSIVHQIPDTNVIAHARKICGPIGYAAYELPGSDALGLKIASEFKKGFKAVILENHGAVLGGSDLVDAFGRFETLEFCARTILYGKSMGEVNYLTDTQITEFENQVPTVLPEAVEATHSSDELEKRDEICSIVQRASEHGLMISSFGTVSERLKGNDFLITPTNMPRFDFSADDIVQIEDGKREPGKLPSRSTWLHQQIYKCNPEINSVIITQSPYIMAFGITNSILNVRTIPESWIFLQDMPTLPFGAHFYKTTRIPELLSNNNPALIIANDSVIVTGDKLIQTFDKLEVAEFSAKSIILSAPLGKMTPINDEQVAALRKVFVSS